MSEPCPNFLTLEAVNAPVLPLPQPHFPQRNTLTGVLLRSPCPLRVMESIQELGIRRGAGILRLEPLRRIRSVCATSPPNWRAPSWRICSPWQASATVDFNNELVGEGRKSLLKILNHACHFRGVSLGFNTELSRDTSERAASGRDPRVVRELQSRVLLVATVRGPLPADLCPRLPRSRAELCAP